MPAPRPPASSRKAATAAVLGTVLVAASLSAIPANAATGAGTIAPYGGYVQDISIVEDRLTAEDDHLTVAVDFCLVPGSFARRGVEDIWLDTATPIADYEGPYDRFMFYTGMTVGDATGKNTFRVEMQAAPLETEVPLSQAMISLYPISGPATSKGGCGTVELPVQIPPYYWEDRSLTKSFTGSDAFGNRFTDKVTLGRGGLDTLDAAEPQLRPDLLWDGSVEWYSITPEGPAESVSLTLDIPGQCSDVEWMGSSAGEGTEDWRTGRVSCAQGVVRARLDGGLAGNERFTVDARDTSGLTPGESVAGRTTVNLDGEYHRLSETVELAEATASFERPWAPVAHGDLCPVSFSDIRPGGAFFGPIQWLGCEGISAGQSNGAFGVNRQITRGELAAFLMRAYGEKHLDPITARQERRWLPPKTSPFTDMTPRSAHYAAATWLRSMGIAGYADGTFKPSQPVSRVEAAQFIYLADHAGEDWNAPSRSPFADIPATYSRFEAISYLYATGATRGYTDGTFRPSRDITRGEMAKFVETVFND
ncbi:S-layer homology domain-containing protein [uncultured Citricoccus sp.]|uniref:S-layer homology domain-containing protein n=1 Tax=uncultured Citricoccus sp. TaxID=614031 RepID=UPI00261AE5BA|nr:S-layer homology domain-containing protein [uncultured Citricoccus sp.]